MAPRVLPRVTATTDPAAPRASATDCPVWPVRRSPVLHRFRRGTRRASPGAARVRVPRPSLPPPASVGAPCPPGYGSPCGLRLAGCRLGLRGCARTGPPMRSRALRPGTSPPSRRGGGREASEGWLPVLLLSALQGSGFSLGGLPPPDHASLRWTHLRTCRFPASGSSGATGLRPRLTTQVTPRVAHHWAPHRTLLALREHGW